MSDATGPKVGQGSYRWYVLGVLMIVYAFSFMDRQIIFIVLEDLRVEFALTDTQLGLLSGIAFAFFYATLGVPIARLADRTNRVGIISIAITVWSAMTAVCGLAGSFWQLFLARVGVGIGEAGGGPPSFSLVSDYFDPTQRSIAMAIYMMGPVIGGFLGLAAGGWVAQVYGWRMAFFAVGLPGLVVAAILYTTVNEPVRGRLDPVTASTSDKSFLETVSTLCRTPVWLFNMLGGTFASLTAYGFASWTPALYLRQFELSQAEVGSVIGTMGLVAGIPGLIIGGLIGDYNISRSRSLALRVIACVMLLVIPLYAFGLMADGWVTTTIWLGTGLFISHLSFGTQASIGLSAVEPQMRALAASFTFLMANLLGLGLGPLLVGMISDAAAPRFGDRSIAVSLAVCLSALVVCSAFYWAAGNAARKQDSNYEFVPRTE